MKQITLLTLFALTFVFSQNVLSQSGQEFIFIHGIFGSADGTWGNRYVRSHLITDYQPAKSDAIDYDDWGTVHNNSYELKNYLNSQNYSDGIAIAHSKGGLVTRKYFKNFTTGRKINRLITIGTPHQGTYMLSNGQGLFNLVYSIIGAFTAPHYPTQTEWQTIVNNGGTVYVSSQDEALIAQILFPFAYHFLTNNIPPLEDLKVNSNLLQELNGNTSYESNVQRAAIYTDEDSDELWRLIAAFGGWAEQDVIDAINWSRNYLYILYWNALIYEIVNNLPPQWSAYFWGAYSILTDAAYNWRDWITNGTHEDNDGVITANRQKYPGVDNQFNIRVDHTNHMEDASSAAVYNKLKEALLRIGVVQPPPALSLTISGPTSLGYNQMDDFTANVSGGNPPYTNYRWWRRDDGGMLRPLPGEWNYMSSWEGQQIVHTGGPVDFSLKCEVTDTNGNTKTDIHSVIVNN